MKDFESVIEAQIESMENGEKDYSKAFVVITNMAKLATLLGMTTDKFTDLIHRSSEVGLHFIVGTSYQYLSDYSSLLKSLKGEIEQALFGMRLADQTILNRPSIKNEPALLQNQGYYYDEGEYTKLRLFD